MSLRTIGILLITIAIWSKVLVGCAHAESRRYELRITYRCAGHTNTAVYPYRSLKRANEALDSFREWARFVGGKVSVKAK